MSRKSPKKIVYRKNKRGSIEFGCLLVEYYGLRTNAWFNDQRVFVYEWGDEYEWDYYLENDKSVDMRYALGGLYYDLVKCIEIIKVWKKKKKI